jgi:hypothetical protein
MLFDNPRLQLAKDLHFKSQLKKEYETFCNSEGRNELEAGEDVTEEWMIRYHITHNQAKELLAWVTNPIPVTILEYREYNNIYTWTDGTCVYNGTEKYSPKTKNRQEVMDSFDEDVQVIFEFK